MKELDSADCGNVATRLAHSTDESATLARLATTIEQVRKLMSEAEIAILSSAEIAFRCHGLEFARARLAHEPGSFVSTSQIVFAVGAQERALNDANLATFAQLVRSIGEVRHPESPRDRPLWRLHPERWLESLVVRGVTTLCRVWTIGCEWRGTTPPGSSSTSGISLDANRAPTSRCFS